MTLWSVYEVLGIQPRASWVLGNHSAHRATALVTTSVFFPFNSENKDPRACHNTALEGGDSGEHLVLGVPFPFGASHHLCVGRTLAESPRLQAASFIQGELPCKHGVCELSPGCYNPVEVGFR